VCNHHCEHSQVELCTGTCTPVHYEQTADSQQPTAANSFCWLICGVSPAAHAAHALGADENVHLLLDLAAQVESESKVRKRNIIG